MNDKQAKKNELHNDELIKVKTAEINSPANGNIQKFPQDALKKKAIKSKNEAGSFYDELHYGNYE